MIAQRTGVTAGSSGLMRALVIGLPLGAAMWGALVRIALSI